MAGTRAGQAAALAAAIRSPDASRALVFAAARDLAALSARDPGRSRRRTGGGSWAKAPRPPNPARSTCASF
ncbi:MAG: hypothetical protein R3F11_29660 [Verrucomicrobiales bacterium]